MNLPVIFPGEFPEKFILPDVLSYGIILLARLSVRSLDMNKYLIYRYLNSAFYQGVLKYAV